MELTADLKLAALEGWAANGAVHPAERLTAALQVIQSLHERSRRRECAAVIATLHYVHTYWVEPGAVGADTATALADVVEMLREAEVLVRGWDMEPGWCCPFCEEIQCDDDCPLARMRKEIDPDA
jgi:hypothetical protein